MKEMIVLEPRAGLSGQIIWGDYERSGNLAHASYSSVPGSMISSACKKSKRKEVNLADMSL